MKWRAFGQGAVYITIISGDVGAVAIQLTQVCGALRVLVCIYKLF